MEKAPASQFYWADLRRDPEYHMLSWASRGIWIEMLSCMHFAAERGKLQGNREQIARMIGCTNGEFDIALQEISVTKTGDVTECNGIVTIINRRMFREERERILTRCRVQRFRNKDKKTHCNENVTAPSSSSSSSSTSIQKKIYKRKVLSDEEWKDQILKLNPHVNWDDLNREMDTWLLNHPGREKTRRFISNWILKKQKDKPIIYKKIEHDKLKSSPAPEWMKEAVERGWTIDGKGKA